MSSSPFIDVAGFDSPPPIAISSNQPQRPTIGGYELLDKLGEGSYGVVYKANHPTTGREVALKTIKSYDKNVTEREIRILKRLQHQNICSCLDVVRSEDCWGDETVHLVFELAGSDLANLIKQSGISGSRMDMKNIMRQLLTGLAYLHANSIFHRDLKPENILMMNTNLKIADFGLARNFNTNANPPEVYTPGMVTQAYRAPEILLGDPHYGPAVDVWSAGVIFAELALRYPIFYADSEIATLGAITFVCGSISAASAPHLANLLAMHGLLPPPYHPRLLVDMMAPFVRDIFGLDLLDFLLKLDPAHRPSAEQAMDHAFFFPDRRI